MPKVYSPLPFFIVFPMFFGVPLLVVAMAGLIAFLTLNYRHLIGCPKERCGVGMTVFLGILTFLSGTWILMGIPYAVQYQNAPYAYGVTIANMIFAGLGWANWFYARKPHRYYAQVALAFVLSAWLAWQAFPWMGELP